MSYVDWSFEVSPPAVADGWWFEVAGADVRRHGPFPDEPSALRAQHELFGRFSRAARARGGWAWRSTAARWVVTVPPGVDVRGRPLRTFACTRHG